MSMPDEVALNTLVAQRGIGPWTAQVFMIMALQRADVWPVGDLALTVAMQEIKGLPERPTAERYGDVGVPMAAMARRGSTHPLASLSVNSLIIGAILAVDGIDKGLKLALISSIEPIVEGELDAKDKRDLLHSFSTI